MLGGKDASDCTDGVRGFLKAIGLEVSLTDLGVEEKDIPWLAENCVKVSSGNLVNTPVQLEQADIAELYRRAL